MSRTRVLIVDDSAVIRRMLTDILSADPEIEVVAAVASGEQALAKLASAAPDVVTLDIEMPGLSGLDTLVELRKLAPRLAVIMFSTLTQRAATTTLEALARGATDYVTKPSDTGSREASVEQVRSQLLPKIKGLARPVTPTLTARVRKVERKHVEPQVIAIAASTGGPNALVTLMSGLRDVRVPIAIVQHMPPVFTRILAERLTATSGLDVREAVDEEIVQPGRAYVAPGDYHLSLVRDDGKVRVQLDRSPAVNSCRPAADVMFRSVATAYKNATLGVVLTGMGQDGLRGCEAIRDAGGRIVVQDEASSVVWGMPGAVAAAGLADEVAPITNLATVVQQSFRTAVRVQHGG